METIKTLARWYLDRVKLGKRSSGDEYYYFDCGDNKAEEEHCNKLSFATHNDGDVLPDDYRYAFMVEALNAIEDASDLDDIRMEADVYTSALTAWLGSRNYRTSYCDEAVTEFGVANADMFTRMSLGQLMEKEEVLGAVKEHLQSELDESCEDAS